MIELIFIPLLILANGVFAMSEMAVVSSRKVRLRQRAKDGDKRARAALELAKRKAGTVEVYSDEQYPYYYRPQLTEFLAGNLSMDRLLRRDLTWYRGRGVKVNLGRRVSSIDPDAKGITLEDGSSVSYDKLLIATGGLPFVPPIEGTDKAGL